MTKEMAGKSAPLNKAELIQNIKDEVLDHFTSNLVSLKQEISSIQTSEKQSVKNLEELSSIKSQQTTTLKDYKKFM